MLQTSGEMLQSSDAAAQTTNAPSDCMPPFDFVSQIPMEVQQAAIPLLQGLQDRALNAGKIVDTEHPVPWTIEDITMIVNEISKGGTISNVTAISGSAISKDRHSL